MRDGLVGMVYKSVLNPRLKSTALVLSLDSSKVYGITRLDSLGADGGKLKKDCRGGVYPWVEGMTPVV